MNILIKTKLGLSVLFILAGLNLASANCSFPEPEAGVGVGRVDLAALQDALRGAPVETDEKQNELKRGIISYLEYTLDQALNLDKINQIPGASNEFLIRYKKLRFDFFTLIDQHAGALSIEHFKVVYRAFREAEKQSDARLDYLKKMKDYFDLCTKNVLREKRQANPDGIICPSIYKAFEITNEILNRFQSGRSSLLRDDMPKFFEFHEIFIMHLPGLCQMLLESNLRDDYQRANQMFSNMREFLARNRDAYIEVIKQSWAFDVFRAFNPIEFIDINDRLARHQYELEENKKKESNDKLKHDMMEKIRKLDRLTGFRQ